MDDKTEITVGVSTEVDTDDASPKVVTDDTSDSIPEEGEICFFGGDISFDTPEQYDDKPDKLKILKSVFSMTHFSLFVYLVVSQGVATVITLFSSLFLLSSGASALSSSDFYLGLNVVCQYVIAFPLFVLMTRGIKKSERIGGERLSAPSFLLILLISEGVMLVGAFLSNLLTKLLEQVFGNSIGNAVDSVVGDSSLWLVFLMVCVCAPIFEELMFRKILIDRLSLFGDGVAIVFSAVAFGFFHGNLSQIIYATGVGLVLGYVYARTRRIGYTIALHSVLNFLGGVLPMGVEWLMNEIKRIGAEGGAETAEGSVRLLLYNFLVSAYSTLQILFIVGAVVALIVLIVKRKIVINKEKEIEVERKDIVKTGMGNPGFILLYAICLLLIIVSLVAV